MAILKARVNTTLLDDRVIELVAGRVHKFSGDARIALDLIAKIVTDFVRSLSDEKLDETLPDNGKPVIRLAHAVKSLNELDIKFKDLVISLPDVAKAALCVMMTLSRATQGKKDGFSIRTLYGYCMLAFGHALSMDMPIDAFKLALEHIVDAGLFRVQIKRGRKDSSALSVLSYDIPIYIDYSLQMKDVEDTLEETLLKQDYYKEMASRARQLNICQRHE